MRVDSIGVTQRKTLRVPEIVTLFCMGVSTVPLSCEKPCTEWPCERLYTCPAFHISFNVGSKVVLIKNATHIFPSVTFGYHLPHLRWRM